jgi:uncharacterized membrane protein YbhN (UPF0104 family)
MPASARAAAQPGAPARPWWPWLKRIALWVFLCGVAWLIVRQARTIEWDEVLDALQALPLALVAAAAAVAAASFALYTTFDLLGRHLTGHRLRTPTVMGVAFISYAFNLNFGSLVGGVAFRYRLYSRLGLRASDITRVLGFSMLTNWIGYLLVAGAAFALSPLVLPDEWRIDSGGLRILGVALLAVATGYLAMCALAGGRALTVRGHILEVPSLRMGALQLLLSAANWSLMGAIVWLLLQGRIDYPQVLAVLLVAAVAGVITHVPAGLGVLEAVFVALLSHQVPQGPLLGALLAYRAVYYLLPLMVALVLYGITEWRVRHRRKT